MSGHRALAVTRSSISHRIPRCARLYHSYERDSPYPYSSDEDAILSAAITHVPEHGFTAAALSNGARDAGYLHVSTNLFPTGAFSLVKYHLVTQRLALGKHASTNTDTAPTSVLDNVRALTLQRLRSSQPIIHRWQEVCYRSFAAKALVMNRRKADPKTQALALQAMPKYVPESLRELARLADEIHFLAGDKSVDTSWYTKRAALSAIYASTELFMTQDKSPHFKETEDFLDRRLEGAQGLRHTVGEVGRWAGIQGMGIVNGLRSKGVRI
ncbi:MAG: hypothetical protein Q9183_000009 [Haloplaca sp. 2 TL-2023]